eukprot:1855718-Rhodomonas_salina.1
MVSKRGDRGKGGYSFDFSHTAPVKRGEFAAVGAGLLVLGYRLSSAINSVNVTNTDEVRALKQDLARQKETLAGYAGAVGDLEQR